MKNLFKVLGVSLIAGMMFAACGGTEYTITVKANPAEGGTVTGAGTYEENETVTLSATANDGYEFAGWADGVNDATRTITVTGDAEYTANFEKESSEPTLTVTFDGASWSPEKTFAYYTSTNFYLQAHKQNNSHALNWMLATNVKFEGGEASITDQAAYNPADVFSRMEYFRDDTLVLNYSDGSQRNFGDYWAQNAKVDVKAYDATTHTLSCTITARMLKSLELYQGEGGAFSGPSTVTTFKDMTVKVSKWVLEAMPSKKAAEENIDLTLAVRK